MEIFDHAWQRISADLRVETGGQVRTDDGRSFRGPFVRRFIAMISPSTLPKLVTEPFPHFFGEHFFSPEDSQALLQWFDDDAPWRVVRHSFYEQCEMDLFSIARPAHLEHLFAAPFLAQLKSQVERVFRSRVRNYLRITAHRLLPGQGIGLHTDSIRADDPEEPIDLHINSRNGLDNTG